MSKSSRMVLNTGSRRYSQPVFASSSSMASRRSSDMAPGPRPGDGLPPPPPHYEDKVAVVEAKGPRKERRKDMSDEPSRFDPEKRNPDGSMRKMHCLPDFNKAYAEAFKARYIRHRVVPDRDKELSVKQVFHDA